MQQLEAEKELAGWNLDGTNKISTKQQVGQKGKRQSPKEAIE